MGEEIESRFEGVLEEDQELGTRLLNSENFQYIDEIVTRLENGNSYIKSSNKQSGWFYTALCETDLMEDWGAGTQYRIKGDAEDFKEIAYEIAKRLEITEVSPRKTDFSNLLKRDARERGKSGTTEEVDENIETPHSSTYRDYFGSFNNALVENGLTPNKEYRPESELEAGLVEAFHTLGRRPEREELREITEISPSVYEERLDGGIKGAMDDLGIPTFEEEFDRIWSEYFGEFVEAD